MSTLNSKITMKALINNGMNLDSGLSPKISMARLEQVTGLRQVSNGGKIIRDDAVPFNKFQIERHYDPVTASLTGVTFSGYRTAGYQRKVVAERIKNRKQKIATLKKLVEKDVSELLNLYETLETKGEDHKLFSKEDVSVIFTD